VGVFIAEKSWKTQSSRSPAPSWTRAKIGLKRVTKRRGGGGGSKRKTACPRTALLRVADFDFVRRRTRHFDWSIYCQSLSVWSHTGKKRDPKERDLVGVRPRLGLLTECTGIFTACSPSCYAVLMSSKKSETAVYGCNPALLKFY